MSVVGQQDAGGHRGADDASDVRPHRVHEDEVLRIVAVGHHLAHPRRHRDRRHAGRTDQWVDLCLAEQIDQLASRIPEAVASAKENIPRQKIPIVRNVRNVDA